MNPDTRQRGLEKLVEIKQVSDDDLVFLAQITELGKQDHISNIIPSSAGSVRHQNIYLNRDLSRDERIQLASQTVGREPNPVSKECENPLVVSFKRDNETEYRLTFYYQD